MNSSILSRVKGIGRRYLLAVIFLIVALFGYVAYSFSFAPAKINQDMAIRGDGAVFQAGERIGQALPEGGGLALHILFPNQSDGTAYGIFQLHLPYRADFADISFKFTSIQGNEGMSATQVDSTTQEIVLGNLLADSQTAMDISLPKSYLQVPFLLSAAASLAGLPLWFWGVLTALMLIAGLVVQRMRKNRYSPTRTREILPTPPEGLSALEMAILLRGELRPSDISALIFDLANNGYLNIVCNYQGIFFVRSQKEEPLLNYEEMLLQFIAPRLTRPMPVQDIIDTLNGDIFSSVVGGTYSEIYQRLLEKGYVSENLTYVHLRYKTAAIVIQLIAIAEIALAYFLAPRSASGLVLFGMGLYGLGWLVWRTGYATVPLSGPGRLVADQSLRFINYLREESPLRGDESGKLYPFLQFALATDSQEFWIERFQDRVPALPSWFSTTQNLHEPGALVVQLQIITDSVAQIFVKAKDPNVD